MKITVQSADTVYVEKYTDGNTAIVGRSPACDVVVVDESLSRQHCKIELIDGDFFITDLNSANGVYIHEVRIPPQTRIPFNSFDSIQLGNLGLMASDIDLTRSHFVKSPQQESSLLLDLPTSVTKKVNVSIRSPKPFSQKKSVEAPKPAIPMGFILSAIVFIGIFGVVIYKMFQPPEELLGERVITKTEQVKPVVRKKLRPNIFLEPITYNEIKTRSSCKGELELCQQLGLNPDAGEGFIIDENALFIFSRPELHAEEKEFLAIKENPDRDILIALHFLLRSTIMAQYHDGTLEEVNLAFLTTDGSIKVIYRLHQYSHSFKDISYGETFRSVQRAIGLNDSKILWDTLKTPLPKLELAP